MKVVQLITKVKINNRQQKSEQCKFVTDLFNKNPFSDTL